MELKLPEWASDPPVDYPGAIEPPEGKKQEGFDNGEEPPAGYFNWIFQGVADCQKELTNAIGGISGGLSSELTELLATFMRQQLKGALTTLRLADDTGASQTLRALALDPVSKVAVAVGDAAAVQMVDLFDTQNFGALAAGSSYGDAFADVIYDATLDLFIACGENGEIQSYAVGGAFTRRHTGGTADYRAIATDGAGHLVVVGTAEQIWTSSDGTAWANRTSPFAGTPTISGVAFGVGVFVCVTITGDIASSADNGVTWTLRQVIGGTTRDPSRVDYHASLGFLYHYGPDVYRSADGVTWVKINNEVGINSASDTPGLLLAPYCWALGFSGTDGTSCDARFSVTAIDAAASFSAHYLVSEPLTWWRFLSGQLWALSGDKVYVGGVL